jgi:hypothetical protein
MGRRNLPAQKTVTTCGHVKHYARGLCLACYHRLYRRGEITEAPLNRRDPQEVIEDVEFAGVTFWSSDRIGYKPRSLANLLRREGRLDLLKKLGGDVEAKRADAARRAARDRDSANAE